MKTLFVFLITASAMAQTKMAGPYTATGPLSTQTGVLGSIPATCTVGQEYFASDANPGSNKYLCTATNTWTQQTGSSCDKITVAISSTNWSVTLNGAAPTTTALSAALSQTLTIETLPAHSVVYTSRVYETVKFAGVTTLSVSGGATTTTDYFPAKSLVAAACSTPGTLASTCVQFNPLGGYAITDASHSFTLTFISTGTNINTLSAGSVDVSLCRGVVY